MTAAERKGIARSLNRLQIFAIEEALACRLSRARAAIPDIDRVAWQLQDLGFITQDNYLTEQGKKLLFDLEEL